MSVNQPAGALVGLLLSLVLLAGTALGEDASRKIVTRTNPIYPALASKMHLTGTVRLEVMVNAAGSVIKAKLVGGNPVFEAAAVEAVKHWKFESAQTTTREMITIEFSGP